MSIITHTTHPRENDGNKYYCTSVVRLIRTKIQDESVPITFSPTCYDFYIMIKVSHHSLKLKSGESYSLTLSLWIQNNEIMSFLVLKPTWSLRTEKRNQWAFTIRLSKEDIETDRSDACYMADCQRVIHMALQIMPEYDERLLWLKSLQLQTLSPHPETCINKTQFGTSSLCKTHSHLARRWSVITITFICAFISPEISLVSNQKNQIFPGKATEWNQERFKSAKIWWEYVPSKGLFDDESENKRSLTLLPHLRDAIAQKKWVEAARTQIHRRSGCM